MSIKNQVDTLVAHIHIYNNPIIQSILLPLRPNFWLLDMLSTKLSGMVHTGVKVCRMDSEMSRLVE